MRAKADGGSSIVLLFSLGAMRDKILPCGCRPWMMQEKYQVMTTPALPAELLLRIMKSRRPCVRRSCRCVRSLQLPYEVGGANFGIVSTISSHGPEGNISNDDTCRQRERRFLRRARALLVAC